MMNYKVYPDDLTPATPHKLRKILSQHGIDTELIAYIGTLKGMTLEYTCNRYIDLINAHDITLPDNIFGVTCNPIYEGDY